MRRITQNFNRSKFVYLFATVLLIASLFYNQILPENISNGIKLSLFVLLIIILFVSGKRVMIIVLSVFLFLSSGVLFYSQYSFNRLINPNTVETNVITFVVLKNSPIKTIRDFENVKIGMTLQTDETVSTYIQDYLASNSATYSLIEATDDISNLESLYAKKIDVLILDNSMRDTLTEFDRNFESKTKTIQKIEKSVIKVDTSVPVETNLEHFSILFSGIDTLTAGSIQEKARSDSNVLMVINPTTHNILTVSIPRDTYVPLGCQTGAMDKLTHSGVYGIDCTVKTVEKLFGIKTNYYIKVNFTAFEKIVSVLGTIDVYSDLAFTTTWYTSWYLNKDVSYTYKVGLNTMNAQQALFFARERHAFADADFQRGINQQAVIKGIINKLIEPATLLKVENLINVSSKNVVTNMSVDGVMKLVRSQISNNKAWNFTTALLKGTPDMQPTYSMGADRPLFVVWPDQTSLNEIKNKIAFFMEESIEADAFNPLSPYYYPQIDIPTD